MSTSKNAKMLFESGQSMVPYVAALDSGDATIFTVTGAHIFSNFSGKELSVKPNGVVSGRNVLSTHASDDTITIAAFSANSIGIEHVVTATSLAITRPATAVAKVCSVTMTSAGAIAEVEGTDSLSTTFVETRGAAGGPPEIPADSVEIGQVRVVSDAAGVIAASEIFQVVGTHAERFDLPTWNTSNVGDGDSAESPAKKYAYIEFDDVIPAIHTAGAIKKVYVQYYTPIFAEVTKALDFVPAENTHSLSSTQYYGGTIGSVSSSLGQASFTALMSDNVTDTLVALKDKVLTFKFFPDRNKTPYVLTQGIMGLGRTFPVDNQNQASVTISAEDPSADFSS